MRKRRKALVWALTGLSIVIAVVLVSTLPPPHRDNQPVYKGRTLAQWLDVVARHRVNGYFTTCQKGHPPSRARDATPEEIKEAEDAIRAIGTNAFPCLLEWTQYKTSFAKRLFFAMPMPGWVMGRLWGPTHRREGLAELGVQAFRILRTNTFAFEALSKMASDTNNPLTQIPASKAIITVTNPPAQ